MKELKIQELTQSNSTTIGTGKTVNLVEDLPPVDISAMKAYSQAIEQTAENGQPEEPVNYGTETERKEKETKEVDNTLDQADEEMNSLIAKSFKTTSGSHFAGGLSLAQKSRANAPSSSELIQLQSSGLQGLDGLLGEALEDENADPAPESTPSENTNVETADEDQSTPAVEQNTQQESTDT